MEIDRCKYFPQEIFLTYVDKKSKDYHISEDRKTSISSSSPLNYYHSLKHVDRQQLVSLLLLITKIFTLTSVAMV